ncbi:MAG: primosomal protein N' [Bacteroidetes bacterium]|nr:primosomal protein N' [Bacteroidota bacterium]
MEPNEQNEYADVVLPLAMKELLTYEVPPALNGLLSQGCRVLVPLGKQGKPYTGIVVRLSGQRPSYENIKQIIDGESVPMFSGGNLSFWEWLADYYMCTPGEVMKAAIPAAMLKFQARRKNANRKIGIAETSENKTASDPGEQPGIKLNLLSGRQQSVLESMKEAFSEKDVSLLHGVTSSGKTEVYLHLIDDCLRAGKQVLYLVPEIALTTHLTDRIGRHFGNKLLVYHSKLTGSQRRKVWESVSSSGRTGACLVLGVRSSLFLPFFNLGLVIVDEEHDTSYKQQDPAPRYHARDASIVLAGMHGARVVLGSATPSIESYQNAVTGKYSLHELTVRHGGAVQPSIILADTSRALKRKEMISHFTPQLIKAVDEALAAGEQVILFRNRRGFSPYVRCNDCGWIPVCRSCAVSLTYHRAEARLKCHYCGYSVKMPASCTNCSPGNLATIGFGTEKIEEELKIIFPDAKVARMDQDTTRARNGTSLILSDLEKGNTDILIGTQMISKGLDFENLTVVGVLQADSMLNYPDFRSYERAFQMMEQVSGRSGRRSKPGKVIIQTSDPSHPVIRMVLEHDYLAMFNSQLEERRLFRYPPFSRLVLITLKHKDIKQLDHFAGLLAADLRSFFRQQLIGPEYPPVGRLQSFYVKMMLVKMVKDKTRQAARQKIFHAVENLLAEPGAGTLRVNIDVDPV